MHSCDNEFIRKNSDIREFRDIMECVAGGEYAPREGASILKYAPRGGVGVAGSASSLLNTAHPARVVFPKSAGWAGNTRHVGAWE